MLGSFTYDGNTNCAKYPGYCFEVEQFSPGEDILTASSNRKLQPLSGFRIVMANDHGFVSDGMRCCLEHAGAEVFAPSIREGKVAETVLMLRPEVTILDDQPENFASLATIKALWPTALVVLVTSHGTVSPESVAAAANASACMSRSESFNFLVQTVLEHARQQGISIAGSESPDATNASGEGNIDSAALPEDLLSDRQLDILRGVVKGLNVRQIGKQHNISYKTVNNHLTAIYRRLGAQNLTQAIIIASRSGLIAIE
jgi:DNA-binding NarL/FixJ family response regulator